APSAPKSFRWPSSHVWRMLLPPPGSPPARAMPELPEVETIVRGLAPRLLGRRIDAVWWSGQGLHLGRKVDLRGLRAVAVGRPVARVRRRGKYILLEVGAGADEGVIIHLGMT